MNPNLTPPNSRSHILTPRDDEIITRALEIALAMSDDPSAPLLPVPAAASSTTPDPPIPADAPAATPFPTPIASATEPATAA
ncbi:MAG TPA: hypothetical protein VGN32_17095, partial [Ktedonobacterales bacterium]|nr:hypothetical protein [Ktedonobacterales bacterium]